MKLIQKTNRQMYESRLQSLQDELEREQKLKDERIEYLKAEIAKHEETKPVPLEVEEWTREKPKLLANGFAVQQGFLYSADFGIIVNPHDVDKGDRPEAGWVVVK